MRVDIYLHASKESNYALGQKLGLAGDVLKYFEFACYEVKVTVEVDTGTGSVEIIAVDGTPLAKKAR